MEHIRPFSIVASEQSEFVQAFRKMVQEFPTKLPRIETSELAKDSRCMICLHEYGLGNGDTDTIEEAEEAVRLPCGHHAGRRCITSWLQPGEGNSCPMCRKIYFLIAPWPHIIPGEEDRNEMKDYVPDFDTMCMTLFRSDYTLDIPGLQFREQPPPGWIVRAAGRYHEDNTFLDGFFHDHEVRRTFARRVLLTSPPEFDNATWMRQTYPIPGELEAHVGALASALETADPQGVLYIQLRDHGGATIHQVDTFTYSDKPHQDEGFFRNLVLRGALDGPPLIRQGRQGSWWAYLGNSDNFSTHDPNIWRETGEQVSDFDSESILDLDRVIHDPDRDGGDTAEADAAFGRPRR